MSKSLAPSSSAAKKAGTSKKKSIPASPAAPSAYHRLDALLHTIRCIRQHEDALCELSHDVKRAGSLTPEAGEELRGLLERIPSHDYIHDFDAVSDLLGEPRSAAKLVAKKAPKKKSPLNKTKSSK